MTKADTVHLRWFDKMKNAKITHHNGLSHIGEIVQRRRHSTLSSPIAYRLHGPIDPCPHGPQVVPGHFDGSPPRRVPAGWRRSRGRPRTTWSDQMRKNTGKPMSTLWTRLPRAGSPAVGTGRNGP